MTQTHIYQGYLWISQYVIDLFYKSVKHAWPPIANHKKSQQNSLSILSSTNKTQQKSSPTNQSQNYKIFKIKNSPNSGKKCGLGGRDLLNKEQSLAKEAVTVDVVMSRGGAR